MDEGICQCERMDRGSKEEITPTINKEEMAIEKLQPFLLFFGVFFKTPIKEKIYSTISTSLMLKRNGP